MIRFRKAQERIEDYKERKKIVEERFDLLIADLSLVANGFLFCEIW